MAYVSCYRCSNVFQDGLGECCDCGTYFCHDCDRWIHAPVHAPYEDTVGEYCLRCHPEKFPPTEEPSDRQIIESLIDRLKNYAQILSYNERNQIHPHEIPTYQELKRMGSVPVRFDRDMSEVQQRPVLTLYLRRDREHQRYRDLKINQWRNAHGGRFDQDAQEQIERDVQEHCDRVYVESGRVAWLWPQTHGDREFSADAYDAIWAEAMKRVTEEEEHLPDVPDVPL